MAQSAERLEDHPLLAGDAVHVAADGTPRLIGTGCSDCGTRLFPPVEVCPECMSENVGRIELSTAGTLYSWSVVHVAPPNWRVPYIAAYVDLPEGVRIFTHVTDADPEALEMDMPVSLTVAVLGEDGGMPVESYAFTPTAA